jgi:hypothetical protein
MAKQRDTKYDNQFDRMREERRESRPWNYDKDRHIALWSWADPALFMWMVSMVTMADAAVILGKTSDGGSLSMTVLDNGERTKFYAANTEELDKALRTIGEHYDTHTA